MKFLNAQAPKFSMDEAARLARELFGLNGALSPLYSERDQNFRLVTTEGTEWVFKIANADEDAATLDCQLKALAHVAVTAPALPVPRLRQTTEGAASALVTGPDGRTHTVYAVSFLAGRIASDCVLGDQDFQRIGAAIASLQRALSGFFHPAVGNRHLLWDVREAPKFAGKAHHLGPLADRASELLADFARDVAPRLGALRAQAIHGDVHGHNLILSEGNAIAGIIDFGDMFHGPAILDLADPMSDFMPDTTDPEAMWQALVRGFNAVQPISPAEIDVLFDLMVMRQLITLLITATRTAETPDDDNYIADAGFYNPAALETMLAIGRDRATALFAAAAGQAAPLARQSVPEMVERRKKVMGSRLYVFYDPPLHMVRGDGVWLYDADGRRYLDCYNNVPIIGHCNARVADAIAAQSRILNTNTRYMGDQVIEYAERLGALTGGALTACAFVNSGSEANDIAWRMARAWTGNQGFLTQEFAYHGITEAIDAISPSALRRGESPAHVRTLLGPDGYRGIHKHGTPDIGKRYAEDADQAIRSLAEAGMKPAAVITDMAFMTNGILEPCPGYVADLFARVRAAGGLCISDEVQSGFGRMGRHFWGYQHHGVTPDFVTIGKPAGNGHPIGVVLTRPEIFDHFLDQTAFFSTFGGNNVSCAAGLAVLDAIRDGDLVNQASDVGAHFKTGLKRLMDRFPIIGDVRGTGLAFGIELVRDRTTLAPAPDEVNRLLDLMRQEGVLAGGEGVHGNIIKMRPPLVFTRENADFALAAMERALARL